MKVINNDSPQTVPDIADTAIIRVPKKLGGRLRQWAVIDSTTLNAVATVGLEKYCRDRDRLLELQLEHAAPEKAQKNRQKS